MEETYEFKKIIIIAIIVGLIIALFYGITIVILKNKENKKNTINETYEANIQYEEIVVGSILNQKNDEYYVLATTLNDENASKYLSDYNSYSSKKDSISTYTVDLDNAFNKKYLKEESDFESGNTYFKTSTLLKISKGKLIEIYEGEKISEVLYNLVNDTQMEE